MIECDRGMAAIRPINADQSVAKRAWPLVLWFSDGFDRTRQQTLGGDFGQCVHSHGQETEILLGFLVEKGLRFYFLPPYSPELNRIEMLWHKMKYEWLPFKTFTPDELDLAIDEIGAGFGSKYTLTFC